jgi:uncharacterized protein YyaL (SSP411 family)
MSTENRLARETSPYLIQHAHNPVDWYPWGPEAFAVALREHKPVHLSIGYSACHWCHVLAHESFEDEATARLLNERFVNIKVDREERPDIDRIYQIAQQLLTRRAGGWPLTVFLTHDDQRPFFTGTYFPKEARYGMPAFKDVLTRVSDYYRTHEGELRAQNALLMQAFETLVTPPAAPDIRLTSAPLTAARAQLAASFDADFGGFGGAPKFPHAPAIERLLRDWYVTISAAQSDTQALHMATFTLRCMADGGINDQLAGGFCRYSVDQSWTIPHFEKMLYDNAALLAVYAQASLATGDPFFARVARETAEWAIREMQSPAGGFYSSFDADSEGHEGKYYAWQREEVAHALTPAEYAVFAPRFGLDQTPNFEGRWHLRVCASIEEVAASHRLTPEAASELIDSARRKLLALRSARVPPARDDKILTSWNALMIRGLALAARALGREDFAAAATRALDFVRQTHWRDGRLLATSKDGRAHLNAYLDDYADLADAVLELQQVRFRSAELSFARDLLDELLRHFADADAGGFFFTSDDHERLMQRSKSFADDAIPSGNAVAAFVLQRMGYLLGDSRLLDAAAGTLRGAWHALEEHPQSHMTLLLALDEYLEPPEIVILRGEAAPLQSWQRELARLYAPRRLVLAVPGDAADLPPALADKPASPSRVVAYICRGTTCSAPIDSLAALAGALNPVR